MPTGDGFVQAYNAQAAADCESFLLVSVDVGQSPTDVTLLTSTITLLGNLPNSLGTVSELLADAGYFSSSNVDFCEANQITPFTSTGCEPHAGGLARFREPAKLRQGATAKERMQHRLKTKDGRDLRPKKKT